MCNILDRLVEYLENAHDEEFDYDVEHWENGNFDDSYSYGWDSGQNSAIGEILSKIKELKNVNERTS